MTVEEVLQQYEHELLSFPEVIAVGAGKENGQDVIHVFVVKKGSELGEVLPSKLGGFMVKVIEVGKVTPHA